MTRLLVGLGLALFTIVLAITFHYAWAPPDAPAAKKPCCRGPACACFDKCGCSEAGRCSDGCKCKKKE